MHRSNPQVKDYRLSSRTRTGIKSRWANLRARRSTFAWTRAYSAINGIEDDRYLTGFTFAAYIRSRLNNEKLAEAYTDKNIYGMLFPDTPEPRIVLRAMHGRYYTEAYDKVTDVDALLSSYYGQELVIKPSLQTGGGSAVRIAPFDKGTFQMADRSVAAQVLFESYGHNFVIQEKLEQSEVLQGIYPLSVNTLRILTVRLHGGINVSSTVVRFGNNFSRVDNQATGGVACGVDKRGSLNPVGYDRVGRSYTEHPFNRARFEGVVVPGVGPAQDLACELHDQLFHFDLVSWDIAIDEVGSPVLIEFNILAQGLLFHQLCNGPLFGELTDDVLARAAAGHEADERTRSQPPTSPDLAID